MAGSSCEEEGFLLSAVPPKHGSSLAPSPGEAFPQLSALCLEHLLLNRDLMLIHDTWGVSEGRVIQSWFDSSSDY